MVYLIELTEIFNYLTYILFKVKEKERESNFRSGKNIRSKQTLNRPCQVIQLVASRRWNRKLQCTVNDSHKRENEKPARLSMGDGIRTSLKYPKQKEKGR